MSKKSGTDPGITRKKLIESGKREFSQKGYQASSLRHICADAEVTTGALYFFFKDKDDLFRSILSEATVPFMEIIEAHYRNEEENPDAEERGAEDSDLKATLRMIDFYYEKKDVFEIILGNLDHPAVKEFFDTFIDVSIRHYQGVFEHGGGPKDMDRFSLHMFLHMQLDLILSLVSHGFDRDELIRHAKTATLMLRGAFRSLLQE